MLFAIISLYCCATLVIHRVDGAAATAADVAEPAVELDIGQLEQLRVLRNHIERDWLKQDDGEKIKKAGTVHALVNKIRSQAKGLIEINTDALLHHHSTRHIIFVTEHATGDREIMEIKPQRLTSQWMIGELRPGLQFVSDIILRALDEDQARQERRIPEWLVLRRQAAQQKREETLATKETAAKFKKEAEQQQELADEEEDIRRKLKDAWMTEFADMRSCAGAAAEDPRGDVQASEQKARGQIASERENFLLLFSRQKKNDHKRKRDLAKKRRERRGKDLAQETEKLKGIYARFNYKLASSDLMDIDCGLRADLVSDATEDFVTSITNRKTKFPVFNKDWKKLCKDEKVVDFLKDLVKSKVATSFSSDPKNRLMTLVETHVDEAEIRIGSQITVVADDIRAGKPPKSVLTKLEIDESMMPWTGYELAGLGMSIELGQDGKQAHLKGVRDYLDFLAKCDKKAEIELDGERLHEYWLKRLDLGYFRPPFQLDNLQTVGLHVLLWLRHDLQSWDLQSIGKFYNLWQQKECWKRERGNFIDVEDLFEEGQLLPDDKNYTALVPPSVRAMKALDQFFYGE